MELERVGVACGRRCRDGGHPTQAGACAMAWRQLQVMTCHSEQPGSLRLSTAQAHAQTALPASLTPNREMHGLDFNLL